MLKTVFCVGALAALSAGPALAQVPATAPSSTSTVPAANIGSTISAGTGVGVGAPGSLGAVTGSPITPGAPLTANSGVVGALSPSSTAAASAAASGQPAAVTGFGVNASTSAPAPAAANPVAAGAVVKSQAGVQMATIDRLIPGADGYVSGVVLRTPSGTLRQAPLNALGLSAGALVTTYNTAQINALPEVRPAP